MEDIFESRLDRELERNIILLLFCVISVLRSHIFCCIFNFSLLFFLHLA